MLPIAGTLGRSARFSKPTIKLAAAVVLCAALALAGCSGSGGSESITPPPGVGPSGPATDVATYHNDNARTGQNLTETTLTTANVNSATFGKVGFFPADGLVDAQPLYLSNVTIPGMGTVDVVYVESENDSVYAYNAASGALLWMKSVLLSGETPSGDSDFGFRSAACYFVAPTIGITATPVIDRARGAMYLIAMSRDANNNYHQRLHALDIANGNELFGGPTTISATYPKAGGGNVSFAPGTYLERAGLLELTSGSNATIYTAWASHCDFGSYTGWIMAFDASTLAPAANGVLNITPNGSDGGIWMSGDGIAADSSGYIYPLIGNGTFDSTLDGNRFPSQGDYGNAFLKISTSGGLSVVDYFDMDTQSLENPGDVDLSSGGALLFDETDNSGHVWHLAVGAGKDSNIYVVNRDNMGKYMLGSDEIYQELDSVLVSATTKNRGTWSTPAYFNHTLYFGGREQPIQAFSVSNAMLSPSSFTSTNFPYPGASPGVSANGTNSPPTEAILWAIENNSTDAVLHAYDATNLATELYNSNQAANGRDHFGVGNKFMTPTISRGRVYVGTPTGVAVFGLIQQ